MISPERTKEIWNALRLHFNSDYNFHQYNGRTRRVTLTEKDIFFRSYANRLLSEEKVIAFYLANFVSSFENNHRIPSFAGDIRFPENFKIYNNWKEKIDDIKNIFSKECYKGTANQIYDSYAAKEISIETFSIIISLLPKIKEKLLTNAPDPFIIPELIKFALKYSPFIMGDKKYFVTVIINKFTL